MNASGRLFTAYLSYSLTCFNLNYPSLNYHVFRLLSTGGGGGGEGGLYKLVTGSGVGLAGRECHMSTRADGSLTPSRPRGDSRALNSDRELHGDGQPADSGVVAL